MSAPNQVNKLRGGDGQSTRVQDSVGQILNPLATALQATPIMGAAPPSWIRPNIISTSGYAQVPTGSSPFPPETAYHKDALGYVHGKGSLVTAAGAGPNVVAFNIDAGYRPSELLIFLGSDGGGNIWEVSISPNGDFEVMSTLGAGDVVVITFTYLAEG